MSQLQQKMFEDLNDHSLFDKATTYGKQYLGEVLDRSVYPCLLYTSPSPRDGLLSRMPSSA